MLTPRYIGMKLVRFVATLFLVTFFTTFVLDLVPGSPAAVMAGEGASPETIANIEEAYGFNQPVVERYVEWVGNALQGDLGISYFTKQPVWDMISERLPVTIELAVLAILVSLIVVVPLSIACATRPDSRFDRGVSAVVYAQLAIPAFVVATLLVWIFAVQLEWLPLLGWIPFEEDPVANLEHAILPVIAISIGLIASLSRVLRADLIRTTQEDYIALARAKGHSTRTIMWKHALKPSSFSLMTIAGLQFAGLIGGTVIVEQIFVLPGIGQLLLTSIQQKDFVVVTGIVTFVAVVFLTVNLIVDIMYGVLDPRTRVAAT